MFARAIALLSGSACDSANVTVPRPNDLLYDDCARRAADAIRTEIADPSASDRRRDPKHVAALKRKRRDALEAVLWVEPNQEAFGSIFDLIDQVCREDSWGACEGVFDDPAHPIIDVEAAETGALLAWLYRRHGARIAEIEPNLLSRMVYSVRQRLIAPILAYDDYDFLRGRGAKPALILADICLCCLMMEKSTSRRQPALKLILHTLDRLCATPRSSMLPFEDKLAEACALCDLVRIMKRMTRGEVDLTQDAPPSAWLDDVLIPWIGRGYFIDPAGDGNAPRISGMDFFRLGYFTRDRALAALGASLMREDNRPSRSVTGRVLGMEYVRAAHDETTAPPRLRRAATEDGRIMLSRVGSMMASITAGSGRANAGDVALFCDSAPILIDAGTIGDHSLPAVNGFDPLAVPRDEVQTDCDFGDDRDLMSADLTLCYPDRAMISAYQRTVMTLRKDQTVRIVDAFEFIAPPKEIVFRFATCQRPVALRDSVHIGSVTMTWDGDMEPQVYELEVQDGAERRYILQFEMRQPGQRTLCGFTFEKL